MLETAALIGKDGSVLHWHEPGNRTTVSLPDSSSLWDIIWSHRENLAGIAHTHPGSGKPHPSREDITTFFAIEAALGRRLLWLIGSEDSSVTVFTGPEKNTFTLDYLDTEPSWMVELRNRSHYL